MSGYIGVWMSVLRCPAFIFLGYPHYTVKDTVYWFGCSVSWCPKILVFGNDVVLVSGCLGLFQNVWVSMFTVSGFLVATEDKKTLWGNRFFPA